MATTRKVRGPGAVTTMAKLKKSLKSSGGIGGGLVKIIGPEKQFSVRFLTEPTSTNPMEAWYGFYEHYDPANGGQFYPCYGGECCDGDGRPSLRYFANVYSAEDKKVMALKLPKGLAEELMNRCEKYGTMKDRWYEIWRTGSGLNDTKYSFDAEPPARFTVKNLKLIDLEAVLQQMVSDNDKDDDEEEEDEKPRKSSSRSSRPTRSTRRVLDDDDDDDDEDYEDDDEDEDDDPPPRRPARKSGRVSSSRSSKPAAPKRTISRRSR